MREALFYTKTGQGKVQCLLCPNTCIIEEGKSGDCHVRINVDGRLMAKGYGNISAIAMDHEKSPLSFLPGSNILSVNSLWCNLKCSFCQNWHIAIIRLKLTTLLGDLTLAKKGIALALPLPIMSLINYEYILDVSTLAREHSLKIVLVSNGYILPKPW